MPGRSPLRHRVPPAAGRPEGPSRRQWLRAAGLAGAAGSAAVLGGCGALAQAREGFTLRQDLGDRPDDELLVTVWAGTPEEAAFRQLAASFEAGSGGRVVVQVVPFSQALTTVDTGLRTGAPPDVFRVTYLDVGAYRASDVLATFPDEAVERLRPRFAPSFWSAVSDQDGVFGVPHHTDTTMVLVNDEALAAAGVRDVPTAPDEAWTWDEHLDVLRRLQAAATGGRDAVAVNWQQAGAYRWLSWVGQAGGTLLDPADPTRAVPPDAPALLDAMATTRGLFAEGLTPLSMTTRSGQYTDGLFTAQQVAAAHVGNFTVPGLEAPFPWTATPLPVRERATADLGGNALVAVRGPREELARAFLEHCVGQEQQAAFCAAAGALPTRRDLSARDVDYAVAPDVMARYGEQAGAITDEVVAQVTVPRATALNRVLVEQLEVAFLAGPDVSDLQACEALVAAVEAELAR